ncbi:MAG: carbohydrate ABC transporter permease [Halothermotrichaceae bacterium]
MKQDRDIKKNPIAIAAFLVPGLLVFGFLVLKPIFEAFIMSTRMWTTITNVKFVGLDNYISLFQSSDFWNSVKVSLIYMFGTTTIQVIIGFSLGYFLYLQLKGYKFFRTVLFAPATLLTVGVGFMWEFVFSPRLGIWRHFLQAIGLGHLYAPLLGNPDTALWVVILVHAWRFSGITIILFNSSFQNMPMSVLEMAEIDGASGFRKLIHILIPLSLETSKTILTLTMIGALRAFDLVYAMTGGGPMGGTEVLPMKMFSEAFQNFNIGMGAAVAVLIFILAMGMTAIINQFKKDDGVEY